MKASSIIAILLFITVTVTALDQPPDLKKYLYGYLAKVTVNGKPNMNVVVFAYDKGGDGNIDGTDPQCVISILLFEAMKVIDLKWDIKMEGFQEKIVKVSEIKVTTSITNAKAHDWCKVTIEKNEVHILDSERRIV